MNFYVLYSTTSSNGPIGLRPQVMWTSGKTIIDAADAELTHSGESLVDMAGVDWIEAANGDMHPARALTQDEVLALSIQRLNDDGRLYRTFATDSAGAANFIEAAALHGLADQARDIVQKVNS